MRVLHLVPYYAPAYAFGGVPRAVEGLAVAQARAGHTVTVLTTDAGTQSTRVDAPSDETRDDVRVRRVRNASGWLRGRANLSTPLGIDAAARPLLQAADVLHIHEFRTVENLRVVPMAARAGVPVICSPHGTLPHGTGRSTLKTAWDALLSPAVARHIGAVIALAAPEADDARHLFADFDAAARVHVVPNGVEAGAFAHLPDGGAFRAQFSVGDGPVILFMGRLHPRKGPDVLARAFAQIAADFPAARLVIAGPDEGLHAVLGQLAADNPQIVLTGYLDGDLRLGALAAADVFVLPAVGEGLPVAVLEAMAAAIPVIVSPGCNLPEVTAHGAGLEVPVGVDALAGALRHLLTDAPARMQMGAAARALVQTRFTWEAVVAQVMQVYDAAAR